MRQRKERQEMVEVKAIGRFAETAEWLGKQNGGPRGTERQHDEDGGAQRGDQVVDWLDMKARGWHVPKGLRVKKHGDQEDAQLNNRNERLTTPDQRVHMLRKNGPDNEEHSVLQRRIKVGD